MPFFWSWDQILSGFNTRFTSNFITRLQAQSSFSLSQAIDYGLKNSNDVKIKEIGIQTAVQSIKEFRATGMPKLNGTVAFQHYLIVPSQPVADFITPSVYGVLFDENVIPKRDLGAPNTFQFTLFQPNTLTGGLELSAMLFDGAYLFGVKASKLYKELIAKDLDITEMGIRSNITKAYASALIAIQNKDIISKNLSVLTKSLNETKALFTNGFAESLDVDRLQLSYDNLSTEMTRVDQLIQVSKNILKYQMRFPLDEDITLSETLNVVLQDNEIREFGGNPDIDYTQRPEYELITLQQSLNELDYKRTKAGYLPTARAIATAQANLQRQNLFDNTQTGWIPQSLVGVSINIPIYDGGDKSAKIQKIKLNQEKTALDKENLENAITLQVTNAYNGFYTSKNVLGNRQKSVASAQNIYDKTIIKFKEGVGSSIEVTQAESQLYSAQANYTNALYDLLSAKVELLTAIGKI